MPGTYPAGAPTLSGDTLSISRFLQSPQAINRRLRDFSDLRFVSDQLLTQRFRSQGGAVLYEQSEPFVSDRTAESVGAGSEYPYANLPTGTAAVAAIQKWGQKVLLTDEEIARNAYAGAAVDRATLNLGYNVDTLVVNDVQYAYMLTDVGISNLLRRETTDNPVYSGQLQKLGNLNLIISPNLPATTAYMLDSQQLGGMADEVDGAPGYAVSDLAVQVKAIRKDDSDAWDMQGRRKTVPVIQEPGAAVKLTNIGI
jgi:hypothetical protein